MPRAPPSWRGRRTCRAGFGDWRALVEHPDVDAVAIAMPPGLQPEIALRALERGKPVFVEKPLAADLAGAAAMLERRRPPAGPAMIDFNFPEIAAWRKAKAMLDERRDRAAAPRRGDLERREPGDAPAAARAGRRAARTAAALLGNFVSHCFHYLEWFCGPIAGLSARLSGLPDAPAHRDAASRSALAFRSGAGGSLQMSCASYLGSGHRLEFYGEDGTLVLANPTADYMRGFELSMRSGPTARCAPVDGRGRSDRRQFPGRHASRRCRGSRAASSTPAQSGGRLRPASPKAIACRP